MVELEEDRELDECFYAHVHLPGGYGTWEDTWSGEMGCLSPRRGWSFRPRGGSPFLAPENINGRVEWGA